MPDTIKTPVTASVQQPPGGSVTEVTKKAPEANIVNQAEAPKQAAKQADAKAKVQSDYDPDYEFILEYATHKLTIKPEQGLNYNYHGICTCAWEERQLTKIQAEAGAYRHIDAHFPGATPRRG